MARHICSSMAGCECSYSKLAEMTLDQNTRTKGLGGSYVCMLQYACADVCMIHTYDS